MYSNIAELVSVIAAVIYYFKKTRDKVALWIVGYTVFLITCAVLFRKLYPNIPFVSPTPQYLIFFVIVGIPFLVTIVVIIAEIEKQRTKSPEEYQKNRMSIFTPTKSNVIFWALIALINLAAFIFGGNK